jgi:hypothetical protein
MPMPGQQIRKTSSEKTNKRASLWCRVCGHANSLSHPEARTFSKCVLEGLYARRPWLLLQIDGSVMPGLVELCTPHLVHALVIGSAEDHGRAKPNVEVTQIF